MMGYYVGSGSGIEWRSGEPKFAWCVYVDGVLLSGAEGYKTLKQARERASIVEPTHKVQFGKYLLDRTYGPADPKVCVKLVDRK